MGKYGRKATIARAHRRPLPVNARLWIAEVEGVKKFLGGVDAREDRENPKWLFGCAEYYEERLAHLYANPPHGVEVTKTGYLITGDLWDMFHCVNST